VLTIVDRNALESESCSCYETALKTYARFMPQIPRNHP
jgi:hypothetical protein